MNLRDKKLIGSYSPNQMRNKMRLFFMCRALNTKTKKFNDQPESRFQDYVERNELAFLNQLSISQNTETQMDAETFTFEGLLTFLLRFVLLFLQFG